MCNDRQWHLILQGTPVADVECLIFPFTVSTLMYCPLVPLQWDHLHKPFLFYCHSMCNVVFFVFLFSDSDCIFRVHDVYTDFVFCIATYRLYIGGFCFFAHDVTMLFQIVNKCNTRQLCWCKEHGASQAAVPFSPPPAQFSCQTKWTTKKCIFRVPASFFCYIRLPKLTRVFVTVLITF